MVEQVDGSVDVVGTWAREGPSALLFGRYLRDCRLRLGLTIVQMAVELGVDSSHLSRLERGQKRPTEAIVAMAVEALPRLGLSRESGVLAQVAAGVLPDPLGVGWLARWLGASS